MSKRDLAVLREIVALHERASFAFPQENVTVTGGPDGRGQTVPSGEFIKDRTRLWFNSWIKGPLLEIIEREEKRGQ